MDRFAQVNELSYFLVSVLCGALAAAVYDFLRARRREKNVRAVFVYIEDVLCLIVLGFLAYASAFAENAGVVRWYGLFGIALGAVILKLILGDRLMNLFRKLYGLFVRVFCLIARMISAPLRLFSRLIKRPISVVVWHSKAGAGQIADIWKTVKIRISNRLRS